MNQIVGILIAFLVFSFIVFIHELGHFILARMGGIGVEEFAIGMGPKLWSIKKGETVYSIRILPIGGFCAMLGEDSAGGGMSADGTAAAVNDPRAFNNRPLSARFWAILAGPLFNFILAFIFAVVLISVSGKVTSTVISKADPEYPAYQAGIREGDKLVKIDGHRVLDSIEASTYIIIAKDKPVEAEVKRGEETLKFVVTPKQVENNGRQTSLIGINYEVVEPNFLETLGYALAKLLAMIKTTFFSLMALLTGKVSLNMLSGPVGIVNEMSKSYGGLTLAQFVAVFSSQVVLLSANLGVMNLLPIPALDGGRLVFLLFELVRGKPIDPKKEGYIHLAGFVLLMLLMVFVFYSDIVKLFQ